MSSLTPTLDYTDRDFVQLRTRIFTLIRSVFAEWTDDQVTNFGNILAELPAFVGDVLAYYQDNQAGESRLTTARLRQNMIAHAKMLGYPVRGATAARATITFTLAQALTGELVIPKGTTIATPEITSPITYQTQEDLILAPGDLTGDVLAENSVFQSYNVTSSGLPDIKIALPAIPYLDGSLTVTADNGTFAQVDNFLESDANDAHYTLTPDQDDRATIQFGNGSLGLIPTGLIQFAYKTGGGRAGRVEANRLTVLRGVFYDSLGNLAQLSATNPDASTPATDREGVEEIRLRAPLAVRTQKRAVSREDYEISAKEVPGVLFALMVTKNELAPMEENYGILYIVPSGGGDASQALLDEVAARFAEGGATPKTITFQLEVRTAPYLEVACEARVTLQKGAPRTTVRARAQAAWDAYFALEVDDGTGALIPNPDLNFGFYFQNSEGEPTGFLAWSDLFNVIHDVQGITKVDASINGFLLNGERDDVPLDAFDFPVKGTLTLIDVDTGQAF